MVTTIIPTLCRDTLYTRAIPSVMAQTVTDWRCVIVGDGIEPTAPDDGRFAVLGIPTEGIEMVMEDQDAEGRARVGAGGW